MREYDILDWLAQMEREGWPLIGHAFKPECDDEDTDEVEITD